MALVTGCGPEVSPPAQRAVQQPQCPLPSASAATAPLSIGAARSSRLVQGAVKQGIFLIRTANVVCRQDIYRNIVVNFDALDAPPDTVKSEQIPWTRTVLTPFRQQVHNLTDKPITWVLTASLVTDTYGDMIGCLTKSVDGAIKVEETSVMDGPLGGVISVTCRLTV